MDTNKQKCKLLQAQIDALTSRVETLEPNNKMLTIVTKRLIKKNRTLNTEQETLKLLPDKLSLLEKDYESSRSKITELELVIKDLKEKGITPKASAESHSHPVGGTTIADSSSLADVAIPSQKELEIDTTLLKGIKLGIKEACKAHPNKFSPEVLETVESNVGFAVRK